MPEPGWKNVALPEKVWERIEAYLARTEGYRSVAEFVRVAVLEKLQDLEHLHGQPAEVSS